MHLCRIYEKCFAQTFWHKELILQQVPVFKRKKGWRLREWGVKKSKELCSLPGIDMLERYTWNSYSVSSLQALLFILFVVSCSAVAHQLYQSSKMIYENFVLAEGVSAVNLDFTQTEYIRRRLHRPTPDLFDRALKEVRTGMRLQWQSEVNAGEKRDS